MAGQWTAIMYSHVLKTNQISEIGPKENSLSSKKRSIATCAIRSRHHQQQRKKKKNYLKDSAQDIDCKNSWHSLPPCLTIDSDEVPKNQRQ